MATYDFSRLSSYDFEELVRDLLRADWRIHIESFKPGRDFGIDLRCLAGKRGQTIIQCKHFAQSGYRKLLSQLRDEELPKIRKLKPTRYVLATSVALSAANKKEITKLLRPFVKRQSDIIGKTEIEGLLKRHSKVETANFKLWLTSTAVLQRVLHNAEKCQTEFEVERVRRLLPIFVQNKAFPRAQQMLNKSRIVVISGVPGIGKTTIADLLLYAHLEKGYEPVVVQSGLEEAKRVFNGANKQVFYFDDFLGETFLHDRIDMLSKNQDAALISFMDAIRRSKNSRFILTTREHILKKALSVSERIAKSPILNHRCVIELSDYTFSQKARIFYNHLYFSDLPIEYKRAVLKDGFFIDVVKHKNFSPRIIEWISGFIRVRNIQSDQYQAHIQKILESPEEIWLHAFEDQISNAARNILFAMYPSGGRLSDLEEAWKSLHHYAAAKYNYSTSPLDFRRALNEIEGSFIKIDRYGAHYFSPSIRDLVENIFIGNFERARDVLLSAVRFEQIEALLELWEEGSAPQLASALTPDSQLISSVSRVAQNPHMRWQTDADGNRFGSLYDSSPETKISKLIVWAEEKKSNSLFDIAAQVAENLIGEWGTQVVAFIPIVGILRSIERAGWVSQNGGNVLHRRLLNGLLQDLNFANHTAWKTILDYRRTSGALGPEDKRAIGEALTAYKKRGIAEELKECDSTNALEVLKWGLTEMQRENRVSFKQAIKRIDDEIKQRGEPEVDGDEEWQRPPSDRDALDEVEVRRLFGSLLD